MPLLVPLLNHLASILYISFFNHSIFYGILTLSYYSLEPFDMLIVTWSEVSEHNFDGKVFFCSTIGTPSSMSKGSFGVLPNIKKYGLNPVTGENSTIESMC